MEVVFLTAKQIGILSIAKRKIIWVQDLMCAHVEFFPIGKIERCYDRMAVQ